MHGDCSLENLGMRENLPVFDREFDYPADELLMSPTDRLHVGEGQAYARTGAGGAGFICQA